MAEPSCKLLKSQRAKILAPSLADAGLSLPRPHSHFSHKRDCPRVNDGLSFAFVRVVLLSEGLQGRWRDIKGGE
jgi:hypothetical protein